MKIKYDSDDDQISEFINGYFHNSWINGNISTNTGANSSTNESSRVRTDFILLKKGTRLSFNENDLLSGFYVFKYSRNKTFIRSGGYFREYFVDCDCYIRLISKYLDEREITDVTLFNNKVRIEEKNSGVPIVKPYISGNFNKLFISDAWSGVVGAAMTASTITDVYTAWETLRIANSGSITRNLLGNGGDANNTADATLPIYEYTISPFENGEGLANKKLIPPPTILINACLHGDEKTTAWQLLHFFTQMFSTLSTDETMAAIKSSVQFKIIPVSNPGGYNANTRDNLHGVNLNRNFDFLFNAATDADKGTAVHSELEAQILRDWLAANQDTMMYIDFHNMGIDDENLSYINTPNLDIQRVYTSVIRRLSDVWKRRGISYSANLVYGFLENNQWPTAFNEAYYIDGIFYSMILEIIHTYGTKYSADVIKMGTELFGNFLFSMIDFISR
jgi:hypothetical protein